MNNSHDTFVIEIDKIDLEIALALIEAFSVSTKILLHPWVMERMFELIQSMPWKDIEATKNTETRRLIEIINRAILHCTILSNNPRSFTKDPISWESILWEIILDKDIVSKANDTLPLLELLKERILTTLRKQ